MPKAKTPAKPTSTKPAAKKVAKAASPAEPVAPPAPAAPAAEAKPAPAAKPAKALPQHPGKEQPMWARMNQGHSQKMAKGRPFRHQGR
jgi:hypothetical protein